VVDTHITYLRGTARPAASAGVLGLGGTPGVVRR
jgi:hypothetical protein